MAFVPNFVTKVPKLSRIGLRTMSNNGYKKLETQFAKPDLDDRSYRYIQLPNDLKALLIHDPKADKAAAALDVNVGAYEDPEELPGLAHFCEHLLFMGSEKYPDENEYSSYLSKHGGSSNAYTGSQNTNYFFEVNHEHLLGALDRFAGFFTCPLFNRDSTDKEIRAVDSENKKNLQSDLWRLYQLDKSLTNVEHPYHKFSTGNFTTLHEIPSSKGIDVRKKLLRFYQEFYSANLMKLCLVGREDLDTLSEWTYSLFKDVTNINRPLPDYSSKMLDQRTLQKVIHARSVKDLKKLEITFAVPDMDLQWESKPQHILSHLVGHEGSGSLLAHLKDKSWANELSAGGHTVSKNNGVFSIDIDLTDLGLEHYEDVTHIIFQYLEMLKLNLPEKWVYLELEDIARANFKFKQKSSPSSTVSSLAKQLEKEYIPVQYILSTELFRKYDSNLLMGYLNTLTPENARIMLASNGMETDSKERWYGTQYKVTDFSQNLLQKIANPGLNPHLHLPRPNEFIATNFHVDKVENVVPLEEPLLLKDDKISKLWYKKDDRFWQPRGYIYISFKLPHTQASITNGMLSILYVQLINDYMKDLQYDAACANLDLSFSKTNQGLDISVVGFNDKLTILLTRFLEGLKGFKPDKNRFQIFKDKCTRQLTNQLYEVPYLQIFPMYSSLINERTWSIKEKLEALKELSFEQLVTFVPTIFEEMFFEVLVHGNMKYEEAVGIDSLVQILASNDIRNFQAKNGRLRSYFLPKGQTYRYEAMLEDPQNLNSCIQHVTQLDVYNEEVSAKASLFAQMIHEPCFDTLRTKEQLGYVVFSSSLNNHGTANIRILVQSEHTTPFLEWRIENFIDGFGQVLQNMSDKDFEGHKDALCKSLTQKYRNMREESSKYAAAIYLGDYNFTHRQRKSQLITQLTKDEMCEFYQNCIVGPKAGKLVLHLQSQVTSDKLDESGLDRSRFPTGKPVEDVGEFKSQLFLAPVRQPTKKFEVYTPKF